MPKEEWGTKRVCPTTGKRFYDLNRNPIVSPYTGEVVNIDTGKRSMIAADAEDQASKAKKKTRKTSICWTTTMSKSIWTTTMFWKTRTTTTSRSTTSRTCPTRTTIPDRTLWPLPDGEGLPARRKTGHNKSRDAGCIFRLIPLAASRNHPRTARMRRPGTTLRQAERPAGEDQKMGP